MARHVAFLRGINVGGHRIRNPVLAGIFAGLGLADATPFIGSGNVVFGVERADRARLEARIEAELARALGYEVATFVRPLAHVVRMAALELDAGADEAVHAIFLKEPAGPEVERALAALETPDDRFRVVGREVYRLRRGRLTDTTIPAAALERALGRVPSTSRNMTTVRRIAERFGP